MISDRGQRGSAALGWVVLLAALASGYLLTTLQQVQKQAQLTRRETFEAGLAVTTHGFANVMKEIFDANYRLYLAKVSNGWPACATAPVRGVGDFIAILSAPKGACAAVSFALAPASGLPEVSLRVESSGAGAVSLGALAGTRLVPALPLNATRIAFTIDQFNPERDAVVGTVFVDVAASRNLAVQQRVRQIIDLSRTLNPALADPECHMCLTVPGSVCCGSVVTITYLDSAGRVLRIMWDKVRQAPRGPPEQIPNDVINQKAVSVRNLATGRTDYLPASFCIVGNGNCPASPTRYVLDAAAVQGENYYLFSDGQIVDGAAPRPPFHVDPRFLSVAFEGGLWYLLRDDGAVLQATRLADPSTYREIPKLRLPTAQALAMGAGPPAP